MIGQLATHLWQSTFFAIAAGLLTVAFRRNPAKIRYGLWFGASVKFLLPFALLTTLGRYVETRFPAVESIATPAVSFAVQYVSETLPEPARFVPVAPRSADWTAIAIAGLWLCGVGTIGVIRLRRWRQIRAAVRSGVPLRLHDVEARVSPGLLEPGVVGLLRPVLLLPEGILERLTPSELEAVVAHELCHVRRRDNLFASIHMLVEAVFWFHPLVWWIGARLLEERERACDEEVLVLGNQPRVYADAILNVCRLYVESPLGCVSGVTGSDITRRIEAIMMNRRLQGLNQAKKWLLAVAGIVAVAGPIVTGVVIGVGHAPVARAQSNRTVPTPIPAPHLVAMLFDMDGISADEQSRLKQGGVDWVRNSRASGDVVSVIAVDGGKTSVLQDFTADAVVLEAAILKAAGLSLATPDAAVTLGNIEQVARMLKSLPEKKIMLYFGTNFSTGAGGTEALANAISAAKQANMAIFPMFAGGVAQQVDASGSRGGRGGQVSVVSGVPQTEMDRRTAYAQANFGNGPGGRGGVNPMARTYIAYGPPDQIDDRTSNAQDPSTIWRYNYLDNFHSGVEFEFAGTKGGSVSKRINYPPPLGTFASPVAIDERTEALANALRQDLAHRAGPAPATTFENLPAVHVSVQTYPAGEPTSYSVSTDGLSGSVDIMAQVTNMAGQVMGTLIDRFAAGQAPQKGSFTLKADSYVLRLVLCEQATGRMFGQNIRFEVK